MLRFTRSLVLSVLVTLCVAFTVADALAQPPQMARDIRTRQIDFLPWLTGPHNFARLGEHLYFGADDGLHGFELWRTDGTPEGTEMVADVCPGQCNAILFGVGASAGGLVYFGADDGVHGRELWATDGTGEGTRMVRDIAPVGGSSPFWLTALGDRMAFTAEDPEHGRELWISDGTEVGTVLVDDIVPGPESSEPAGLLSAGGTLFFNAWDPVHGREPWASDGTPGAAARLADVRPGDEDSMIQAVDVLSSDLRATALDGLYVFVADDGVHSRQIWVSDGSSSGTVRVSDISFNRGSVVDWLTTVGSHVFFSAIEADVEGGLWKTDGTPGGTVRVTDRPTADDTTRPAGLTAVGSRVFYSDGTAATGPELWVSDGTEAGTQPVADIFPGPESSLLWTLSFTGGWELDDQRLLFFPNDGTHSTEPWVSDGTAAGTFLLRDIAPGGELASHFGQAVGFTSPSQVAGGLAFFAWSPEIGYELWWTDGTPAGTRLLRDFDRQTSSLTDFVWFSRADLADVGGRMFFSALHDELGMELWISGGTPGTTRLVKDVQTVGRGGPISSFPAEFLTVEDRLVFQTLGIGTLGNRGGEAWRSDGTEAGTYPLVEPPLLHAGGFAQAAGAAFFTDDDDFWASDGTQAGTRVIDGVEQGLEPTEVGGVVLFSGTTAATGQELYRLDDTLTQATLVADLLPGPESSAPRALTAVGDLLLFAASTPAAGRELWVSDGSGANTRMLADIHPGAASSIQEIDRPAYGGTDLQPLVASGPRAFVAADDGVHGTELWVSDGTPAGTRLLADLRPGPLGSNPVWMTDVGGRLYFVAEDGATGAELWTTDGTAAGTRRVADLAPGAASSSPRFLVDVDGALHFAAFTPTHGVELWRLDAGGAPERVADILPGPDSSSPSYLTVAGRRLFFFANDGVHGFEPWSLVLPSRKLHAALSARRQGATVFLDVLLSNPTPVDQPDADGDELVLPLPAALTPVAVEATGGVAEIVSAGGLAARAAGAAGAHTLLWNGALAAGATETISVELTLGPGLAMPVTLQAQLFFDTDADGANDLAVLSDDPSTPGAADPTVVSAPLAVEVPALGPGGVVVLTLLLTLWALRRLRPVA